MSENINTQPTELKDTSSTDNLAEDPSSITILLVDDEQNILSSLRRLFRPVGYKILMATSGQEGLELFKEHDINLVISDMRMPEMDGAEFLAKVAKQWPDTIRILLTGYADMTSTIAAINEGKIYKYISKPWEDNDIVINVRQALEQKQLEKERDRLLALTNKQNKELQDLNSNLEEKVKVRTEEVRQTMGQLELAHSSLKKNYVTTIKVFSNIIELRDGSDSSYTRNIADLAHKIAKKIGMSDDDAQQVIFASLLRNIGRIGFSDELNQKAFNSLSHDEASKVIKHPVIGQGILMALDYLQDAANIIRSQYERYDGEGFPDKLKGEKIPLGARIITLANDYYAQQAGLLSSQRLSMTETKDYIKRNRGKRYDPKIVDVMFEILGLADADAEASVKKKIAENKINSLDLKEGMVLARDLAVRNGVVLLAKGHELTEHLIRSIQKMECTMKEDLDIYIFS